MQPGQIAVGMFDVIKVGLLSHPENAKRHQAEQPGDDAGAERREPGPKLRLRMNVELVGNVNLEDQHRHRKSKNAVAERGDAAKVLSGDAIVKGHGASSSHRNKGVNGRSLRRIP